MSPSHNQTNEQNKEQERKQATCVQHAAHHIGNWGEDLPTKLEAMHTCSKAASPVQSKSPE